MNPAEDSKPDSQNMDVESYQNGKNDGATENSATEPPMYKKVKLSEVAGTKEGGSKSKKEGSKKHKDRNERNADEKGETHDKRDRKKSREASSSKKPNREGFDNNQRCSKCKKGKGNMITCSSCPRSYHLECVTPKLEDVPKGTWNCEKCGPKGRSDSKKKKKSKKDKAEKLQTQLKLENLGGANKKTTKTSKKYKDETEKKFQEFARKYPQYMQKGKVKFPIEDRLLVVFAQIFETGTKIAKPQAKKGIIPPKLFGDVLQIWNFFYNYSDLFKFEDIEKEEIYAALQYKGPQYMLLLQDMHQGIASLFLKEIRTKNRFDTQKDEIDFPFFVLAKNYILDELNGDEMTGIWTEFVRNLFRTPQAQNVLSATSQKNVEILAQHTAANYNALDYKIKVKVLIDLIELLYDTELFRDFMHKRMDEVNGLVREKNELIDEIKKDEAELRETRAKAKELETAIAKEESKRPSTSRVELARKSKDIEGDKREHQKLVAAVQKLDSAIQKKKSRLHKITTDLVNPVQTATLIGLDSNKSEYWLFYCEPHRIYVKYQSVNPDGEETWLYYDKQEELDVLLKSLNPKGIREKNLIDNLQGLIKSRLIELEQKEPETLDDIDEDIPIKFKDETRAEQNGEHKEHHHHHAKKPEETLASSLLTNKDSLDYWFAKVIEYEVSANEDPAVRTTRSRQKQNYKKDSDENSYKNYKNFSLPRIKDRIKNAEKSLSDYLGKWGSRWAKQSIKDEIMDQLEKAEKPQELAAVLIRVNEEWQKCEALKKKANYDDIIEEEEEAKANGLKQDEDKSRQEEDDDEEFYFDSEVKKKDDSQKDETKPEEAKTKAEPTLDEFDENLYRIKRIPIRLWSLNNERLKRCWITFTASADNLSAVYFSAVIFCDIVTKYTTKKLKQYFNPTEKAKEQKHSSLMNAAPKNEPKNDPQINLDEIDQFRFTRSQARELRDGEKTKTLIKSKSKYLAPTRRKESGPSGGTERPEYKYMSSNANTRSKQEKLNELAGVVPEGVRRSGRNINRAKMIIRDDDDDDEEYFDSKPQKVVEEPFDPNFVKCQMCNKRYRLQDLGLKAQPEGSWQCFDCLEKIATQRQTRSSTRRFGY